MSKGLHLNAIKRPDTQNAAKASGFEKDKNDRMVKTFMQFLDDTKDEHVRVAEDFSAPAASGTNTPGMGNVVAPSATSQGSGDKLSNDEDEDENKLIVKSFEDFLKKSAMNHGKG